MAKKFEVVLSAKLDENSVKDIQKQINSIVKGQDLSIKADSKQVNSLTKSLQNLGSEAKNAKSHTQGLSDIVDKFSRWQVVGDVIHGVKNAMGDMVQQVFDLDQSLTELDKVTDLSSSGLQKLADDAFTVGERIGATGKDILDATTIFAQAGYGAKEALDLSEQATTLKNVSEAGATAEGSANTLIATMKAFKLEASDSGHVVDALNEVSNKYAVSVNDLSTAIRKSSASMAAGNNSLEETFGLVAAGTEILREPGRVANGLSTITARLTAENDEYIASITGGEGVIDKQTGELRSTFDILQDLAGAWENLTSVEKQELAETVAGKTQRSLFTAIMTNFETAVGATEAALNSEGSAAAENEKRMDSLQGKVQQLEGAWQNFARNTINSEAVKSLIDLGTQLIKLADSDIGRLIIALASAKAAMMLFNKVMGTKAILTLSNSIKTQLITAITAMTISFKAGALSSGVLTGSLTALGTAIKGIGAALAANPIGLAITAFAVLTSAISSYTAKADEARQQSAELADKYQQEAEEAQGLLDTYNKLSKDKFRSIEDNETLSKTIEDLSKKYGVSEEALKSEGEQRDEAIKKIEDEIEARKLNAALQDEASVKWKNTGFLGLGGSEKEIFTSREMVDIQTNLADKYDTTGNTVAEVQKKLEGYITTLQNKSNKTKEEEKDLQKLKDAYSKVTDSVKTYGDSYAQSLSNFKEGIPITAEQANVLYQLGEITLAEAQATQSYNEWLNENKDATEEVKDAVYEGLMAQVEYQNQLDQNSESTKKLTDEQIEIKEKVDSANKAFKDANTEVDNYQKAFSTLTSAVDEYNSSGYMSIDTLQSLMAMDEQYLSMLSMENGQLVLNTQEMDNYINTMIAKKAEDLQAAATQDLLNLSLGNTSSLSSVAKQAIDELNTDVNNTKTEMQNTIPTMQQFGAELDNIAAKYGKGLGDKYKDEAGAIVDKYKNIFGTISGLGKTTSRAGGTSGSGHRYTGSSKGKGSSGGKKSGSSKSAKEEYKAEVDALYWYKNALDNAKESVDKLEDALKNTDNFNEQEKYIRQLIDATNNQINKTNDLKNAQVGQINDFINQLRQQGFAIDYNASQNELYINNMQHLSDLTGDAAKNAEKLLDKIQDLNDDNRDLDSSIRDLTADVKDYYDQLADIPEKKLEKFNELMEEFQQSRLDQIQNQIDDLEHEMKNDPRLQALNEQIEALEKQNDEIDKQKEMEEKLLAVEEAKLKLENARRQKTLQVYRERCRICL